MGQRYHGYGAAAAGTNKTLLALISAATVRPKLYDLILGSAATPADVASLFHLERFSAVGTEGSGFTPQPVDPYCSAAVADYAVAHSGEPTYSANEIMLAISLNQRATFRWVAAPGGEIVLPATANNGVGLQCQSSGGTPTCECTMFHEE